MRSSLRTYDIGLAPHCPLGPIAFAACLQIGFSTPNFVICEMSWKVQRFSRTSHSLQLSYDYQIHYNTGSFDLLTYIDKPEVFAVQDGMVSLLEGPGLGISVNEDMIRKEDAEYRAGRVSAWRNPVCECCAGFETVKQGFNEIFIHTGRGLDGAIREW